MNVPLEEKRKFNLNTNKIKQVFISNETEKEADIRRTKHKDKMAKNRQARSELQRLLRFQN